MTGLQIFENKRFGQVRTVLVGGQPFIAATDTAKALGYKNPHDAITRHCRWVAKHEVPHPQSKNKTIKINFIPEGDIYRLIVNSELPAAEKFEEWVFDEVLPSIRKTGMYTANQIDSKFLYMLAGQLEEKEKQIAQQQREIEHKTEVIKGVTDDIDIYTKRNVLNKVVRYKGANFAERWNELYERYREVHSIDLKARCEGHNLKQAKQKDKLSVIKYAEAFGHIDNLYRIALKLYETEINEILKHLQKIA